MPGSAPGRASRQRSRTLVWPLIGGTILVVLVLLVDLAVLSSRVVRLPLRLPVTSAAGETWVVVGLDDRAEAADPDNGDFGSGPGRPEGARADVVIVVRPGRGAVTITRDLVLTAPQGDPVRLATTWWQDPQVLVDTLCVGLGVGATHVAALDMRGFQTAVDTLGGLELTLDEPLRDRRSGLDLPAGRQRLDGRQALALVRSRQTQVLRDGLWQEDPGGEVARERRTAEVAGLLVDSLRTQVGRDPGLAHRLAWRVLPDLRLDERTSLFDLTSLFGLTSLLDLASVRDLPPVAELPVGRVPGALLAEPTPETGSALAALGLAEGCTPAR